MQTDDTAKSPVCPSSMQHLRRYEMKATGRADLAANEKVLDLYTSNLQLEEQLQGVRRQVSDAKGIAEKVWRCRLSNMSILLPIVEQRSAHPQTSVQNNTPEI